MAQKKETKRVNYDIMKQNMLPEVAFLELIVRKNRAQKELTGFAIEERLDALTELDFYIAKKYPVLYEPFQEFVQMFLHEIRLNPDDYAKRLAEYKRQTSEVPEDVLRAIHSEKPETNPEDGIQPESANTDGAVS